MKVGVLALQGAYIEHMKILRKLGAEAVQVRLPEDLDDLDGLIIPGGESTAIGKLAVSYEMVEPIRRFAEEKAVWGTCAGMILMADRIVGDRPHLKIMDIEVERNVFGRQIDSFEAPVKVSSIEGGEKRPFPAIFIRAPKLVSAGKKAEVTASLPDGTAVAAKQGRLLVTAFHPELSNDDRFHRYFLELTG